MRLEWTSSAWNDYVWQDHDRKIVKRINLLIKDVMREPSDGSGTFFSLQEQSELKARIETKLEAATQRAAALASYL